MEAPPPRLSRREALDSGASPEIVDRAVQVAGLVGRRGATPVYTLRHLSVLTGASYYYLRDIIARRRDPYVSISRPKKDGRTRPISSPEPVLMDVQRWILRSILGGSTPSESSFAYVRNRSILHCANEHRGAKWLIKLDIHNFFHSIPERLVFEVFADIGYPRLLSLELARLCTRARPALPQDGRSRRYPNKAPYHVRSTGVLPQGSPTSGALANLVMARVDETLASYAGRKGLTYTRYSDDIAMSTRGSFSRDQASEVISDVSQTLKNVGLMVHRAKTRVVPPGGRKVLLGLLLDHNEVLLLPEFKRRIEVHIRGVERHGLPAHAAHRHFDSMFSMVNHIDGCIAFAKNIDERYAEKLTTRWTEALRAAGFPR